GFEAEEVGDEQQRDLTKINTPPALPGTICPTIWGGSADVALRQDRSGGAADCGGRHCRSPRAGLARFPGYAALRAHIRRALCRGRDGGARQSARVWV